MLYRRPSGSLVVLIIGLYGVLLSAAIWFVQTFPANPIRLIIVLLPLLPVLYIPVAVVQELQTMDELQRRIQLEAFGIALAVTAVCSVGYGLLEIVGLPRQSSFIVWPLLCLFWGVGLLFAKRRYQ